MLGEASELRVWPGAGKNPCIPFGDGAPTLTLERTGDDCSPAALGSGVDDLVDEFNEIVWEPNGDLFAHPKTVAKW